MTKYEIMAHIMREDIQFEGEPFTVAAKLASCLEPLSMSLQDHEFAELLQICGAIYRLGINQQSHAPPLEELFPACDKWPLGAHRDWGRLQRT